VGLITYPGVFCFWVVGISLEGWFWTTRQSTPATIFTALRYGWSCVTEFYVIKVRNVRFAEIVKDKCMSITFVHALNIPIWH
jgi:hypothetical protein